MSILDKIVTPAFVAFQAHCWFAYMVIFTFGAHLWPYALGAAAFKEFYIDKHFEADQSFKDNLTDWVGYATGVGLALLAMRYLR
jgi:hypothetical protein